MPLQSRLLACCVLLPVLAIAQPRSNPDPYQRAQGMLNSHRWQDALDTFNAPARPGSDPAGMLYWKAFAQAQLGRRTDALAGIAQIRAIPGNGWLAEAAALETALHGDFKPEPEQAELYKPLDAARGNSDRFLGVARKMLSEPHVPEVKNRMIFEIQRVGGANGRALLEELFFGGSNPDVQRNAISSLGRVDPQALLDAYWKMPSVDLKSFAVTVLGTSRDKKRVLEIARAEKAENLRSAAYIMLLEAGGEAELKGLLDAEPSARLKQSTDTLMGVRRKNKEKALAELQSAEPGTRRMAAIALSRAPDPAVTRALQTAYGREKDSSVKNAIVFGLIQSREFELLRALAGAEEDLQSKRMILQQLIQDDEGIKTIR